MGSAQSSEREVPSVGRVADDERRVEIARELASLRIDTAPINPHASSSVTHSAVGNWRARAEARPGQSLASTVLHKTDFNAALIGRSAVVADQHVYSHQIPKDITPVTNQMSSGRCWLFATTNIARIAVVKNLGIDGPFELSQSALWAWDCIEKANMFLELAIELAEEPLDGRTMQYLMTDPENDGGQWDMVVNLIVKYGLVPKSVYPESHHSSNSGKLNELLTHKLREFALVLRRLHASKLACATTSRAEALHAAVLACRSAKTDQMATIYDIVATCCGPPPAPDAKFAFEYRDSNKKFCRIECTPLEFARKYAAPFKPSYNISIINDPRNAYHRLYTVKHLNNIHEGRPVLYVNAPSKTLSDIVIAMIKAGQPVWFGCDVGQASDSTLGLMDPALRDYEPAFGTTLNLTKAERLQTGDSSMTHAMVINAVHLNADGKPFRYRVENSWSDTRGDKGYFLATQAWFEEFVLQVVAPRDMVPKQLREIFEQGEPTVLPPWDPMGSLA